jgi:sortase A
MTALAEHRSGTLVHSGRIDASPPPGNGSERVGVGTVSTVLLSLSLVVTWVLVYLFGLSGFEQAHAQDRLYGEIRSQLAEGTAPMAAPIAPGAPVAVLSIPQAGVRDLVVVEGTRPQQLQDGPGHAIGTVLPGQLGTSTLAGRSISFGGPFARLPELSAGATVSVTTGQGTFRYQVLDVRHDGDPLPPAAAPGAARMVLITTARLPGGLGAAQTVYVDAELAEGAVPAGRVGTPDPDPRWMKAGTDPATLAFLVLALQLLVATLAGFAWAWQRWSRTAAWIAGAPCVLAALWLASSIASLFLPGLV